MADHVMQSMEGPPCSQTQASHAQARTAASTTPNKVSKSPPLQLASYMWLGSKDKSVEYGWEVSTCGLIVQARTHQRHDLSDT